MSLVVIDTLGAMAADGLTVADGIVTSTTDKKITLVGGTIYANIGARYVRQALIDWHQKDAKPEAAPKIEGHWTLITFNKDGIAQYTSEAPYPDIFQPPWAWGNHAEMAIALMRKGATAEEAVKQISEWSIYVGGEVQVESIKALGHGLHTPTDY